MKIMSFFLGLISLINEELQKADSNEEIFNKPEKKNYIQQ